MYGNQVQGRKVSYSTLHPLPQRIKIGGKFGDPTLGAVQEQAQPRGGWVGKPCNVRSRTTLPPLRPSIDYH